MNLPEIKRTSNNKLDKSFLVLSLSVKLKNVNLRRINWWRGVGREWGWWRGGMRRNVHGFKFNEKHFSLSPSTLPNMDISSIRKSSLQE